MSTDIIKHWPIEKFTPRKTQTDALIEMAEQSDKKYIICELPVGVGKSLIGLTYSRSLTKDGYGNSYVLVPQKILQKQYEETKLDQNGTMASLYGKGNYECDKTKIACNVASLIKRCSNCSHTRATTRAVNTKNTIMNYTLALLKFKYTETFDKRSLMILDECHNLESQLISFETVNITVKLCKTIDTAFRKFPNIKLTMNWISKTIVPALITYEKEQQYIISELKKKSKHTPDEKLLIKEFASFINVFDQIITFMLETKPKLDELVLINSEETVTVKPIYANTTFKNILEPMAKKFLFMSSTIIDYESFCNDLGIPLDQVAFITAESEFSPKNRECKFLPTMKMSYDWLSDKKKSARVKFTGAIDTILAAHKNDSGVIHTGNFKVAEYIIDQLSRSKKVHHTVFHHNPSSKLRRDQVIKDFIAFKGPAVLISPSVTEGLDLKGDLARFNIIAKVPYKFLGDPWIKKRMDLSGLWYTKQAVQDIIQASGRVVRSADDFGTTYIIDSNFSMLYSRNRNLFPKWWQDAYS